MCAISSLSYIELHLHLAAPSAHPNGRELPSTSAKFCWCMMKSHQQHARLAGHALRPWQPSHPGATSPPQPHVIAGWHKASTLIRQLPGGRGNTPSLVHHSSCIAHSLEQHQQAPALRAMHVAVSHYTASPTQLKSRCSWQQGQGVCVWLQHAVIHTAHVHLTRPGHT